MRIGRQIEPGGPSLDPRQRDQLDRIEADGAEPDRLGHGEGHDLPRHRLQQPQHLDELALAAVAHAGLQQMAQVLERLRQIPALQRRRLIERVRLGLDQRQIVQRIEHERALAVGSADAGRSRSRRTGSRPRRRSPSPRRPGSRRRSAPSSRCSGSGPARSTRPAPPASRTAPAAPPADRAAPPDRRPAARRSSAACRPARSPCRARQRSASMAFSSSKLAASGIGVMKFDRAYFTSPSTLPLSLPLPGRPKRSRNR